MGWFIGLPEVMQFIIVESAFLLVGVVAYSLIRHGVQFQGKGFFIRFSKKKPPKRSPHSSCIHRGEAVEAIRAMWKNAEDRFRILYTHSIEKQMEAVEGGLKYGSMVLLRIYTRMLKEHGASDPIMSPSCRAYMLLLDTAMRDAKDLFRRFIKEDHFYEKSEVEFASYIDIRTNELAQATTEALNNFYFLSDIITRGDLYDKNMEHALELREIARDVFMSCRRISTEMKARVDEINRKDEEIFKLFLPEEEEED